MSVLIPIAGRRRGAPKHGPGHSEGRVKGQTAARGGIYFDHQASLMQAGDNGRTRHLRCTLVASSTFTDGIPTAVGGNGIVLMTKLIEDLTPAGVDNAAAPRACARLPDEVSGCVPVCDGDR